MLFVVVSLLVLGGATLYNMTLALLIGLTIGIYSSLSNASPLWYDLRRMEGKMGVR
jgi:preprotein translocase subunit SecF